MSFDITVSGSALEAVDRIVPQLVSDLVASRIAGQDETVGAGNRVGGCNRLVIEGQLRASGARCLDMMELLGRAKTSLG